MKKTNHQLKALANKTSKSVCSLAEFHHWIKIHEPRENQDEVAALAPIVNTIDISQGMQFSFKLNLKGQPSPIKLKLEYIYIPTGESLNKVQMLQLKNFMNFYCSKTLKVPQPLKSDDPSQKTFD